jgi:hypothetical protein
MTWQPIFSKALSNAELLEALSADGPDAEFEKAIKARRRETSNYENASPFPPPFRPWFLEL